MELERIPAASAMDWSIDLDRGLRSRQPATRVRAVDAAGPRLRQLCATAPAPVASAYGVLPEEARVFAETMLLRLATEFRTADGAMRARIVKTLLNIARGPGAVTGALVAEPDQLLRRIKVVYDTGNKRDRALALRVFGCLDFLKIDCKNRKSIMHDLIHCALKFANACHEVLCETSGVRYNPHDSIKGLIKYVHQDAPQHWSTYESFHLIMCACVAQNTCRISGGNQESGDSKEHHNTLFAPSVWINQELCALRMTKTLIKKQKYWEAYRCSMYCYRKGLWFTASFVFRKLADAFETGSFSFWLKSLLLLAAGEIEMKLLFFPSATVKLVGELKMEGDFSEDLYCTEEYSSLVQLKMKGGPGAAVEPTVCNRKVPGSSPSLCTFVWVRPGA